LTKFKNNQVVLEKKVLEDCSRNGERQEVKKFGEIKLSQHLHLPEADAIKLSFASLK
jgi:hypothetical protein